MKLLRFLKYFSHHEEWCQHHLRWKNLWHAACAQPRRPMPSQIFSVVKISSDLFSVIKQLQSFLIKRFGATWHKWWKNVEDFELKTAAELFERCCWPLFCYGARHDLGVCWLLDPLLRISAWHGRCAKNHQWVSWVLVLETMCPEWCTGHGRWMWDGIRWWENHQHPPGQKLMPNRSGSCSTNWWRYAALRLLHWQRKQLGRGQFQLARPRTRHGRAVRRYNCWQQINSSCLRCSKLVTCHDQQSDLQPQNYVKGDIVIL